MDNVLKKLRSMDRSLIYLFVLSILASVLNYAFQIMLGNMLSLADFGNFNTINSLSSNMMCLYSPLAVYICRICAENQTELVRGEKTCKRVLIFTSGISLAVFSAGMLLFAKGFGSSFGVESFAFGLVILFMTVLGGFHTVFNGMLQGIDRMAWYGFLGFLIVAVKLVLSYLGIRMGRGLRASVWAMLFSYITMIILIIAIVAGTVRRQKAAAPKGSSPPVAYRKLFQLYGFTFLVQMMVSPYINGGEIILMNFFYDNEAVGLYSLAATIAKIGMYVLSIAATALLPDVAADWAGGKDVRKKFYLAMAFCLLFGAAWVLFLMTAGLRIIPWLLGAKYYTALLNVKYMALWVIGIGMLLVANTFYLAVNRLKRYLAVLVTVTVAIVCVVALGSIDIVYVPLVAGAGVMMIVLFTLFDVGRMRGPYDTKGTMT